jgi:protein-S-isoprenylcysteine O-methyltransferase Ste14
MKNHPRVVLLASAAMHASSPTSPQLALRVPPAAVTVCAGALGWIGARACPALAIEYGARPWLTTALVAVSLGSSLGGVVSFRQARTTVNPMTPEAATTLVTAGIYRITRNPMYLGFLFLLLAEVAWLANPVAVFAAAAFVLYLNLFQISPEERALETRFGSEYRAYSARVRRWI